MRRVAAAVDVIAVVLFVAIGRATHHDGEAIDGFASTVWPFAVGLAAGWLATARKSPTALTTGLTICVVTVASGMVLRVLAGQGTAAAFVGVALGFLGALMVGSRALLRYGSRTPIGRRR